MMPERAFRVRKRPRPLTRAARPGNLRASRRVAYFDEQRFAMFRPLLAAVLLLATSAALAADDEVIAVDYDDLPKLWKRVAGSNDGELIFPPKYRAGCARFSFIVEANGQVSTFKVLGSFPDFEFGEIARKTSKRWRYEPTTLNKDRTPAYTETTIVWVAPGADRVLGSNRREKIDPVAVRNQCMLASLRQQLEEK